MSWGGARANAGRPAKGPHPSEPHKARPELSAHHPVHVIARVIPTVGTLRRRDAYRALRCALATSLGHADFRVVHLALHRTRLELVVEADDKVALARGMQGFQVAAARHLNRAARRAGTVFPDRYRPRILITRAAVRAITRSATHVAWPQTWLLVSALGPEPAVRSSA